MYVKKVNKNLNEEFDTYRYGVMLQAAFLMLFDHGIRGEYPFLLVI